MSRPYGALETAARALAVFTHKDGEYGWRDEVFRAKIVLAAIKAPERFPEAHAWVRQEAEERAAVFNQVIDRMLADIP